MAAELKLGDSIPAGVTFSYVPYTPENGDITACGIPINYDASKGTPLLLSLPFPSTSTSSFCQHPFYYPAQNYPAPSPRHSLQTFVFEIPNPYTRTQLTIPPPRMGQQESRRLLRPRRLHPWLLCKASPWLHREPRCVEGKGR